MFGDRIVLDTLRFDDLEIFLKRFHVERTFEALRLSQSSLNKEDVFQIYDQIEKNYCSKINSDQILRLFFKFENGLHHSVEVVNKSFFSATPRLQVISRPLQKDGLGPQNYKWQDRSFWNELLKDKSPDADDLILTNTNEQITETTRCNLFFFDPKMDLVITPSLNSGCINGVYRRFVMSTERIMLPENAEKNVLEKDVGPGELKNYKIFVANSVRGILPAHILE